ncbi:MAG TPA: exodeoxyribonuclease VII large subunit [Anaeromyxobacteraceae bacterium]|nr:exodeoxyribonuclease VII large subunit [Anaeromyxobacteraceae bacterium]
MARTRPPPPVTGDLFARAAPRPMTVGELTRALKAAIEPKFRDVWVSGEVGNLRRQASGHLYFTLKDDEAVLPCALWSSQARRVRFDLREGLEVVARGFVEIYPPHGKYQLIVQEVEPRGAGARALLLAQIKERLEREGLLDPARKRPLPFLPRRIGVATSPSGAALRDFLRVVHARFENARVLVAPCRVQGDGAAATVISAVRALVARGVDVVVVTRGGGSAEDLWEFNDERLARTVADCPVPVVSAVGHEVDVTVCDLAADVRAATPTHAAQLVVPEKAELLGDLSALRGRLGRAAAGAVADRRRVLRALRAELGDPGHLLSRERHRLDDLLHRAEGGCRAPLRRARGALDGLRERLARCEPRARLRELRRRTDAAARRLEAWPAALPRERLRLERLGARLAPANVARLLSRGFALALADGRVVHRSGDVGTGDPVRLALGEGWLDARVTGRDAGEDPLPAGARGDLPTAGGVDPSGRPTVRKRDGGES